MLQSFNTWKQLYSAAHVYIWTRGSVSFADLKMKAVIGYAYNLIFCQAYTVG